MKVLEIHGRQGDSKILIGEGLERVQDHIPDTKVIVITDTTVGEIYGDKLPPFPVIRIGTGEGIKTLETVAEIFDRLLRLEADRGTFLLGVGGGIVCDITGLVASTYLRGVRFGFVSSTLLSQVDASVGGKNGVNLFGYKNIVGVFNQPECVICDPRLLETLPDREFLNGFAEIVKHAAIADYSLFCALEDGAERVLERDPVMIEKLVYESVRIKSEIVNRDEREGGERRKLNFGHTFGHAIEKVAGVSHGEAVSLGMVMAADFSVRRGGLPEEASRRIQRLLDGYGLPTRGAPGGREILDALLRDKKRKGDRIHFVLLAEIGKAVVEAIPIPDLKAFITP